MEKYFRVFADTKSLVPRSGMPLTPLLSKGQTTSPPFRLSFLGEVLLLSRGVSALVSKDRGLITAGTPLGNVSNIETAFTGKLMIRLLKHFGVVVNLSKATYKGIPSTKRVVTLKGKGK